jgi:hypothetical protein
MNTRKYFNNKRAGWCCVFALLIGLGSTMVYSQSQIVYHSFNSGFTRSVGNNSILNSMLGQSIFGVSGANGVSVLTGYTSISKGILSSVKAKNGIAPVEFALYQNFPNPFNPSTTIRYGLPAASRVTLKIYNILGQQIAEIVNQEQSEGTYEVQWNAIVASGLYFYRIEAASVSDPDHKFTQLKKMVVLK